MPSPGKGAGHRRRRRRLALALVACLAVIGAAGALRVATRPDDPVRGWGGPRVDRVSGPPTVVRVPPAADPEKQVAALGRQAGSLRLTAPADLGSADQPCPDQRASIAEHLDAAVSEPAGRLPGGCSWTTVPADPQPDDREQPARQVVIELGYAPGAPVGQLTTGEGECATTGLTGSAVLQVCRLDDRSTYRLLVPETAGRGSWVLVGTLGNLRTDVTPRQLLQTVEDAAVGAWA